MSVGRRILKAWRRGGGAACRALTGLRAGSRAGARAGGGTAKRGRRGDEKPVDGKPATSQADGGEAADHETAELTAAYWRAYDQRMATVKFSDVARRFPALIGQAMRLGWQASRR